MVPFASQRKGEKKTDFIKRYTLLLYDQLPQTTLEDRAKYIDIRDKIIELNTPFFGYIVQQKFLNNSYAEYEDKLQACIARFCECWMLYKFEGVNEKTNYRYRTDLAFSVFFKPRLGEMLERDFNEVQYSLRRSLCKEVGDQIDKHWAKVTYEDLADPRVKISSAHKASLMAMFGSLYPGCEEDIDPFLKSPEDFDKEYEPLDDLTDEYDDLVSLIMHEMVRKEKKLTAKDINKMADMYSVDVTEIKDKIQLAEAQLYQMLTRDVRDGDIEPLDAM